MTIDFSHQSYLDILGFAKSLGYKVGSFRDVREEAEFVLLRHDVDFSLEKAVEMAELDCKAGVRSTFFVLLTAPYYNALSEESGMLIREIADMGHEIGLHIDLTGFDELSQEGQQTKIKNWAAALGSVTGCAVASVAQHKPASTGTRVQCPGFVDAYADRYFRDIGYISDSRMQFVEPDVYEFFKNHKRSQMLIHPIWWNASPSNVTDVFTKLGLQKADSIRIALEEESASISRYKERKREALK